MQAHLSSWSKDVLKLFPFPVGKEKNATFNINEIVLKKRTGLDVLRVEVGAIDFSKDTVMVKMYYVPLTNEVNSVNQVGRLPKVG